MKNKVLIVAGVALFIGLSVLLGYLVLNPVESDTNSISQGTAVNSVPIKPKEVKLEGQPLTGFTPLQKIETLEKIDTVVGQGEEVQAGDTVTAHYTGAVAATGIIFQSSLDRGEPIPFGLDKVIQGWSDGVPGMRVGGKRRLLIPAAQAYGENPPGGSGIPANADLVFDIEIVKIGR